MNLNNTIGFATSTQTVSTTALVITDFTGITDALARRAGRIRITCLTNTVSFLYNGTVVTASTGHVIATGATVILDGNQNIMQLSIIRAGGSDASVVITLEA